MSDQLSLFDQPTADPIPQAANCALLEKPCDPPQKEKVAPIIRDSTKEISLEAGEVLAKIVVSQKGELWEAKIHEQLERDLYTEVNNTLLALLGKWNGRQKAHVFPYDPTEILRAVAASRCKPENNPLDYFPTPKRLVQEILEYTPLSWIKSLGASENASLHVLEPSAGAGNIVETILDLGPGYHGKTHALELDPLNAAALERLKAKGLASITQADFLDWFPSPEFHPRIIIMNPPFSNGGNNRAYIDHIFHAWEILKTNPEERFAALIAITPKGWTYGKNKKEEDLKNLVALYGRVEELPKESFAQSGTKIDTLAIHLEYLPSEDMHQTEAMNFDQFMILMENSSDSAKDCTDAKKSIEDKSDTEARLTTSQLFVKWRDIFLKDCMAFANTPQSNTLFLERIRSWE